MKGNYLKIGAVLLLLSVILPFVMRDKLAIGFGKPVDIYEEILADAGQIKAGLAIDTELYMLMDAFGYEEITTKSDSGAITGRQYEYYYTLPIFAGEEDVYYVAYKVSSKDKDYTTCKKMAEETMDYLCMESDTFGSYTLDFSGGLVKLDDEMYDYMLEWFEETGWYADEAEMRKYVLPLNLTKVDRTAVKVIAGIDVAVFLISIAMLWYSLGGDIKYAKRRKQMNALGDKIINIAGKDYYVAKMTDVDRMIWEGKTDNAKKELQNLFKASPEEADSIIAGWNQITSV